MLTGGKQRQRVSTLSLWPSSQIIKSNSFVSHKTSMFLPCVS